MPKVEERLTFGDTYQVPDLLCDSCHNPSILRFDVYVFLSDGPNAIAHKQFCNECDISDTREEQIEP